MMAALKLSSKEIKLIFRVFEKKRVCGQLLSDPALEFRANAVASIEMAKRAIGGPLRATALDSVRHCMHDVQDVLVLYIHGW